MTRQNPRRRATKRSLGAAALTIALLVGLTEANATAQTTPDPTTTTSTQPTSTTATSTSKSTTTAPAQSTTTTTTDATTSKSTTTTTGPPVRATAAAAAAPITAAAVPAPGAGESVITVKVGGDRSGPSTVLPKAGVTLQLFDNDTTTTPTTFTTPNTCVSDADGDCNWTVSDTGAGGSNFDRRFWVRQIAPPAPGTYSNLQLNTGTTSPFAPTTYQFQTCLQLRAGQTCSSQSTGVNGFMLNGTVGANNASGGIWQTSRSNPTLSARCGLRVALILDLSSSVAGSIPELKTAATTFVNSLVGTASSVGLFTFASNGPANTTNNQNRPLTSVSTSGGAATVNGWINGVTDVTANPDNFTNWDRALNQVTETGVQYDVAVMVTDGDPTAYGIPPTIQTDGRTQFRETENGIFSANGLKAKGTRIVAFGVGAGIATSGLNLSAISGPTLNSDYFQTTNYPQAAGVLRALALGACAGTVSVIKQVIPPGGTTATAVPAPGWTFGATTSTSGVTIDPASAITDATGGVNFNLTFPGGTDTAAVTVDETQKAGFVLAPQGGFNATCKRLDTNAAVTVTNSGTTGFQVGAAAAVPISCTVYNQASPAPPPAAPPPPPPTTTLTLIKTVRNDDGGTAVPTDWTLRADGPTPISGITGSSTVTDATVDAGTYTLSETGPAGYAATWTCNAGTLTGTSLVLPSGVSAACYANNNDVQSSWTLAKTSNPATGSRVNPDDTITYTVTAHKIGGIDPTNLTVTDNLSGVLTHARIHAGSITASTGTPTLSGNVLTWTIPRLSSDATLTYKVTVRTGAFGVTIANDITGSATKPTPPPVDCAAPTTAAGPCTTIHTTGPNPSKVKKVKVKKVKVKTKSSALLAHTGTRRERPGRRGSTAARPRFGHLVVARRRRI